MLKKQRIIWIDDQRNPKDFLNAIIPNVTNAEIVWLKSYREWVVWALTNWFGIHNDNYEDYFCLDHDLGDFNTDGVEYTGSDVANDIINDIVKYNKTLPHYECHSTNPAGRENILSKFETYKKYNL